MKKDILNILIGSLTAVLIGLSIIYSIENNKSFIQIFLGFIIFIFPFSFLSSFTSKIASFILVFVIIMLNYITYKLEFHDLWIGTSQAFILGFAIYFYRVRKTTVFSKKDYIEKNINENNI
tara:strand:+ start:4586 stop:4948 length:363 start_codon:yes stop_codon:yes gene_type:complete